MFVVSPSARCPGNGDFVVATGSIVEELRSVPKRLGVIYAKVVQESPLDRPIKFEQELEDREEASRVAHKAVVKSELPARHRSEVAQFVLGASASTPGSPPPLSQQQPPPPPAPAVASAASAATRTATKQQ